MRGSVRGSGGRLLIYGTLVVYNHDSLVWALCHELKSFSSFCLPSIFFRLFDAAVPPHPRCARRLKSAIQVYTCCMSLDVFVSNSRCPDPGYLTKGRPASDERPLPSVERG